MEIIKNKRGGARPNTGGRRPGAGRKSKAEEMGLAALLDNCWPVSDRKHVIRTLHLAAKNGNARAAALLLAYTYGKPHETVTATITHREFEVEIGGSTSVGTDEHAEFVN